MSIRIAAAVVLLVAGSAAAQESSVLDPKAKNPGVVFRSVFEDYRPFGEQKPVDWRQANDEVRDVGGHLGLAKGQGPGGQTSKPQPGSPEASGGAHGGHHK